MKRVVAGLILQEGKLLVCQRTRHQTMPLKWEFPGGKIESGEQPRDALRRELEEELGIEARVGDEVARIRHTYKSGGAVELRFYLVEEYGGELRFWEDVHPAGRSRSAHTGVLGALLHHMTSPTLHGRAACEAEVCGRALCDNAGGSPQSVPLSGTGTRPGFSPN